MPPSQRVLILPGWQNSDAAHWQSRWQSLHGFERVEQSDWDWPRRGDWMSRLEEALLADPRPAVLVAQGLGCQLVAAWAAHSRQTARVRAALLVAPSDTTRADLPPQLAGWRVIPRQCLPFKALVVHGSDDPGCSAERAQAMAADWGAGTLDLGRAGPDGADRGLGDWAEGLAWLHRLQAGS